MQQVAKAWLDQMQSIQSFVLLSTAWAAHAIRLWGQEPGQNLDLDFNPLLEEVVWAAAHWSGKPKRSMAARWDTVEVTAGFLLAIAKLLAVPMERTGASFQSQYPIQSVLTKARYDTPASASCSTCTKSGATVVRKLHRNCHQLDKTLVSQTEEEEGVPSFSTAALRAAASQHGHIFSQLRV